MTEANFNSISGLYPRTRSKRIYIHRPLDETLVEVRPDLTVLIKDAFGRKGSLRRGYGFAFAASSEKPQFLDYKKVEQAFLFRKAPVVSSLIREGDFEHRCTFLTSSDVHGQGRIHLFMEVKNVHATRKRTGHCYFLSTERQHDQFYVHTNEDYIPFRSEDGPWLAGMAAVHEQGSPSSGRLLASSGDVLAHYQTKGFAGIGLSKKGEKFVNALKLTAELEPGESAYIELEVPYPFGLGTPAQSTTSTASTAEGMGSSHVTGREAALAACQKLWADVLADGMILEVPDSQVQRVLDTITINLFQLMASNERGDSIIPGQGGYNDFAMVYSWEVAFYIRTLDRLGYSSIVERILNYFMSTQDDSIGPDGDIKSAEGSFRPHIHWMCETGVVLNILADHYMLTRDRKWIHGVIERALRACGWIASERAETKQTFADGTKVKHYGLLPAGRPHDWPVKGYFYFSDVNTWKGLQAMAQVLKQIGHPQAQQFIDEADDYKACILQAVEHATYLLEDQDIHWISNEVYAKPDERVGVYSIDGPISLVEAGLWEADHPFLKELEQYLRNEGIMNDLFSCKLPGMEDPLLGILQEGFAHGEIDLYYVNNSERTWHRIWIEQGEREKALRYFWSTMAFSTTLDTGHCHERFSPQLPWLSPWQPNGSGSGRLFDMIADSLFVVREGKEQLEQGQEEQGRGHLELLPCVPGDWLGIGKEIRVAGAQTMYGEVSFSIVRTAASELKVEVEAAAEITTLHVNVPAIAGSIDKVSVTDVLGNPLSLNVSFDSDRITLSNPLQPVCLHIGIAGTAGIA
ncbi:hypothetical protein [Paenibacillus eucommiae]|uniref:Uncharacterized protein n=1 Tax=Paenibacillus eucommiae TaxID=1355755 RepID=A0ABS4ISZ4_9BACL|nr:hypothetical protein [Paenibacillus eucommiae]MBP1990690.1 hypothetical protein [Paenibacillus eucommiae]